MVKKLCLLILLGSVLGAACAAPIPPGQPKLPEGFLASRVLDIDTLAYAYLRPTTPVSLAEITGALQVNASLQSVSVWVQEDGAVSARVKLSSPQENALLLEAAKPYKEFWVQETKEGLVITPSVGEQFPALKKAVTEARWTDFPTKYPKAWQTMQWLPRNPPSPTIGVGFASVDQRLLPLLKIQGVPSVANLTSALSSIGVDHLVMGLYAEKSFVIAGELSDKLLTQETLSMLVIARPTLPPFMVAPALSTAASQGKLEKVTIGKEEVFYSAQDPFQGFIRYNGSVLYIAISPSRERAKSLILSAMS